MWASSASAADGSGSSGVECNAAAERTNKEKNAIFSKGKKERPQVAASQEQRKKKNDPKLLQVKNFILANMD